MRQPFISAKSLHAVLCAVLIFGSLSAHSQLLSPSVAAIDPEKTASELNHHIAGIFLVAIGLSLILSERLKRLRWMRWLPPVLFIAAGLFLAAWSDDEIWPRGSLSWMWLLQHDPEARQHKLYALLLVALGCIEAMQLLPQLRRQWMKVVFLILCALGGVSLLFHHHSSEVALAGPAPAMPAHHHHPSAASFDSSSTPMSVASDNHSHLHEHDMSGVAAKVQKEHTWFAVIGFWVALFKFLYDSAHPPARVPRYLWANSIILLGFLLLLYTE